MSELAHAPEAAPAPPPPGTVDRSRVTPVDGIGMPLPLEPLHFAQMKPEPAEPDWHHHFHPRRSPILTNDDGGKAIRNIRLQLSGYRQHHIDYHGSYDGPPLPETVQQQFGIAVLASAGYVPDQAISFVDGQPKIIELSERQRRLLWRRGDLKIAAPDMVRKFMIDYTTSQNLSDVNDKLVDEFLNTSSEGRRQFLGGVLLDLAIEKATEPISIFYKEAWTRGLVRPSSSPKIQRVIKDRLRYARQQTNLVNILADKLAA